MNSDKNRNERAPSLNLCNLRKSGPTPDAYAKLLVNRRLVVPESTVAGVVEFAREQGTNVRKKAAEIIDNAFAENLEKSGFLKELWGGEVPK